MSFFYGKQNGYVIKYTQLIASLYIVNQFFAFIGAERLNGDKAFGVY